MNVAQLRGVKFYTDEGGHYKEPKDESIDIAVQALDDVARWLGFKRGTDEYLDALVVERKAIFKRARSR